MIGEARVPGPPPRHPPYAAGGRMPGRGEDRILLVSEFFPDDPGRNVYGAFQRLRLILDGARATMGVDLCFFWHTADRFEPEDVERRYSQIAAAWGIDGALWLCRAGRVGTRFAVRQRLADLPWALGGVVGFFSGRPTMRSCGSNQAEALGAALRNLRPRLILAHGLGPLAALCRVGPPLPPIVADFPDIDHVRLGRTAFADTNLATPLQARTWSALARMAERRGLRLCKTATVCSEVDRHHLLRIAPDADVQVLPNAVGDRPALPLTDEPLALYVATLGYPPNLEAALWLLRHVWPQVRAAVPGARLDIVGDCGERLLASGPLPAGVQTLGFLESLEGAYAAARFVVCPIQRGSGTRIKILEAAAYGRPVVSTPVGAEGLDFADGREILLRDDPTAFAEACIALLGDKDLSESLGRAAQARARASYGRAAAVETASRIFSRAMALGPSQDRG